MDERIKIKDGFLFMKKSKIKAGLGLDNGEYPFYTSSPTLSKFFDSYEIGEESLIFGTGGNASIHYSKGNFSASTDCLVIQNNKKYDIDLKYIYCYFLGNMYILENGFKGAGLKHISKKYLEDLEISLPPLETQKKTVVALDKAQALIDARKEQIRLMDELIQSVFYEMFGDPVANPKGWDVKELKFLCDIHRGGSPRPIKDFLGGTVPWIKIGDATKGDTVYLNSTKEHIIKAGVKNSRLVKSGSLIFANCGVSLGFARIISFDGCIHDGWLSFEQIDESIRKIFLLKLLNCYTEYFRKSAPDGTQPNLNIGIMEKFTVIVPPIKLQEKFIEFIQQANKSKLAIENSLDELNINYEVLMQKAFKGSNFKFMQE
ncbi:MAG: restriction endonuclease subunit S [Clostridia bacterium]|nr:restriction endonuclease subunit S [Clostridia bacterium]